MSQLKRIHQVALGFGSLVLAVSAFLLSPAISELSILGRVVGALLSLLTLGVLVTVVERVYAWWLTRRILGQWFYVSKGSRGDPSEGGGGATIHYAVATFELDYPELRYSVLIMDRQSIDEVLNDPKAAGHRLIGSASSEVVSFNGGDVLQIIYTYRPTGQSGLAGLLRITGASNGESMTGEWVTLWRNAGNGTLEMLRKERFKRYLAKEDERQAANGGDPQHDIL